MKAPRSVRLFWLVWRPWVAGLAFVACTPDPIVTPARNLERPSDMAFACVERVNDENGRPIITGRPMHICNAPPPPPPTLPADQEKAEQARYSHPTDAQKRRVFGTFGLLTNTARGEVAIVDLDGDKLADLDIETPGFNQVPVGALPEVITSSDDGCRAVTANRGTCDLSVLDVSGVVSEHFQIEAVTKGAFPTATQLRVKSGGAPLFAQPRDVVYLPSSGAAPNTCRTSNAGEVLVTFPHCALVAVVDVASGDIRSSMKLMPDGTTVDTGPDPTCPVECTGTTGEPPVVIEPRPNADAGAPLPVDALVTFDAGDASSTDVATNGDGGGDGATPFPLPVPGASGRVAGLAVMPDASRAFIGLGESPYVVALDLRLDDSSGSRRLVSLGNRGRIPFIENPIGFTRLRLSVDPFAAEKGGRFVGRRGSFLYAFARDGSVRVLDIAERGGRLAEECDVNVDPSAFGIYQPSDGCIPVSARLARQPLAKGPGLRVPATRMTDVAPAVPIDIAFAEVGELATGFLLASSGQVMHVALGPWLGQTGAEDETAPTHGYRPAQPSRFSRSGGPPRVDTEPTRNFSSTDVPFATKVAPELTDGPRLEPFSPVQSGANVWVAFPPSALVPPQGVRIEWQGVLPGAARRNGLLGAEPLPPAPGARVGTLDDVGANFCQAGVEVGDIVTVIGCSLDTDCDRTRDEMCYRSVPGGPGVCVPRAMAADEQRMLACRLEFSSRRRYEVKGASRTSLQLGLKLDEVERPAVAPCQLGPGGMAAEDPVCQPDPAHAADARISGDRGFSCQPFSDRPRCVKPCGGRTDSGAVDTDPVTGRQILRDDLCRPGYVCAHVDEAAVGPVCVEAPAPKAECLTGEIRYAVQAGRAYRVTTESLPQFVTQIEETPGGACVPLPNRDRRFTDRIRLDAALCATSPTESTPAALGDFIRSTRPSPTNPCMFRSGNTDEPGSATATPLPLKALFENPYMSFVVTDIADYVGDAAIITFQVLGGFEPLLVSGTRQGETEIALGTRIITGPIAARGEISGNSIKPTPDIPVPPYLYVIDQGRTLRELSRGQLLRLNPRPWLNNEYYGGFFDGSATVTAWPIQ
jgi:hypothetical protein